ncbi:MAG: hypothetical protein ACO3LE_04060 [Bdellovibrionota bacterium]
MKKLFVLTALFFCSLNTWASSSTLTQTSFESAIAERLKKVEEFEFAKQVAEKIGVRVFLFGGTASSFGHYVRESLTASEEFRDFYDFDYTSIYRSTQDADLVIDGTDEQAQRFEQEMMSRFDHLQGNKSVWEVRTLRESRKDKGAILDDFDFLNQHTDSNSVGLIELTDPPSSEARIRDTHHWNEDQNPFLESIRTGSIQFYFSEAHEKTTRFRNRQNPPIFSVIRFLTKAFQHDLEISSEDLKIIKFLVRDFDPKRDLDHPYTQTWIEKNAKKLLINSRNVERSWNILEEIGLRAKLLKISSENHVDSAAWWLSKEPLRSFELGQGKGQSAAELGLHLIAHETRGQSSSDAAAAFRAFESITASPSLSANVFISRQGQTAETAAFGEGFYTQIGSSGVGSSGYTIRFELDPNAREGSDFALFDPYVIVKNKNAIRILPEKINKSPMEYLESLTDLEIQRSDRAVIHQFSRRVLSKAKVLGKEDLDRIFDFITKLIRSDTLPSEAIAWALQILEKASNDSFHKILTEIHDSALRSNDHWRVLAMGDSFSRFFMKEESFAYSEYFSSVFIHLLKTPKSAFTPGSDIIRALRFQMSQNPNFKFKKDEIEVIKAFILKHIQTGNFWLSSAPILILMHQNEREVLREIFESIETQNFSGKKLAALQEAFLYGVFAEDQSLNFTEYLSLFVPPSHQMINRFYFERAVLPHHIEAHSSNLIPLIETYVLQKYLPQTDRIDTSAAAIFLSVIGEKKIDVPSGLLSLLSWLARKNLNYHPRKLSLQKREALDRLNELSIKTSFLESQIKHFKHLCRRSLRGLN